MLKKLNDSLNSFQLRNEKLSKEQFYNITAIVLITFVIKYILIPYNMIDHGEGATRTWNALWWAQQPFFVLPLTGNPGWFYLAGPLIMITQEIFYTPIILMMIAVTIAGVYIFKLSYILTDFKTSIIAFLLFTFNPAIFRLNYTPVPQQLYLAALCIMIYYFTKAALSKDETAGRKNFIIAGIFSFIGLTFRPEALFVLIPFCILALLITKKGRYEFIVLSLLFQVIWMGVSYAVYGSFFKTFEAVRQYDYLVNSQIENSIALKLKGFFLPYYFMVVGLTIFVFYFFIKGTIISYKKFPLLLFLVIFIPVFVPSFVNGLSGTMSTQYHTTRYFYSTFYYGSFIAAIGLYSFVTQYRSSFLQWGIVWMIILTAIPLSYIKELVPHKYNKLFPKVVEFIATSEDPEEAKIIIQFIDEYINQFPALIFDPAGTDSSILYLPFRTRLSPPGKVLINGYNTPDDKAGMNYELKKFIDMNPKGMMVLKKDNTILSQVLKDRSNGLNKTMKQIGETERWVVLIYE